MDVYAQRQVENPSAYRPPGPGRGTIRTPGSGRVSGRDDDSLATVRALVTAVPQHKAFSTLDKSMDLVKQATELMLQEIADLRTEIESVTPEESVPVQLSRDESGSRSNHRTHAFFA